MQQQCFPMGNLITSSSSGGGVRVNSRTNRKKRWRIEVSLSRQHPVAVTRSIHCLWSWEKSGMKRVIGGNGD
ncbi:hypothetical protein MtrunA17_Chr1g0171441 [Medicago truncatula]|uniref:Uncharacterized protein n=1 Tax=Medicago truncatula TaxID=3880 RepID=A0A396JL22_MEDTR|nr:hypothetical protein MtrunA17_Chr1g0171441 [Medicago truncatula]